MNYNREELELEMTYFIIDKEYYHEVNWIKTWQEFYNYIFIKTQLKPELSPEKMRKMFTNEILPRIELLNLNSETKLHLKQFTKVINIEVVENGYKLKQKQMQNNNTESFDYEEILALFKKGFPIQFDSVEFENIQLEIDINEEQKHAFCIIVQTDKERFQRINLPFDECFRRLKCMRLEYLETGEIPANYSKVHLEKSFRNEIILKKLLMWFGKMTAQRIKLSS